LGRKNNTGQGKSGLSNSSKIKSDKQQTKKGGMEKVELLIAI